MEYLYKYVMKDNIFNYDDFIGGEQIHIIYKIKTKKGKKGILN